jgi:hypothetical protein
MPAGMFSIDDVDEQDRQLFLTIMLLSIKRMSRTM